MSENNGNLPWTSKLPLGAVAVAFLLTLAIWIFFYLLQMPLQPPATTVVAAVVLGAVWCSRWLWSRLHNKGAKS